jgi:hypothetical protein
MFSEGKELAKTKWLAEELNGKLQVRPPPGSAAFGAASGR